MAVMEVCCFAIAYDSAPILMGINLKIMRATFTVFVGLNGCEKSVLLGGLLGEAHLLSGRTYIHDANGVGYCGQQT
ncbi:hypothetical protein BJ878DRAFT_102135 [Calycina marina]|uniref:ABC transporter domain-containing protein n=1 Tax=Calycina marina TaxID=1763456 RepID=A0A9P7Z2E0_9HELO|nr:hypothetical protein BJ878DRAFT_102135 [Calycina marina]